ncbi:hypothetical protein RND81_13G146800 [Saponaria officinalis]|uniref:Protein FAR1-RELATED SEQUENCE n=1 Tax=Saponaria officinalis TaxID=3572 RepID=A0AAW1H6A3_SAPOF
MDEGAYMTSNATPCTPIGRQQTAEKSTPPILLTYSPKGSQQWIRKVEEEFTPRVGMEFDILEDGIQFYRIYAIACGFDIRKSSQKRFRDQIIRSKHIVCHREGYGESKKMKKLVNTGPDETTNGKSDNSKEKSDNNKGKSDKRKEICKKVANGYENVGASLLDFKNFQREVKLFIGDADAEMFINNLEKLVHSKKDAHGKSAFLAFGDGVSFDPTYGTNKYYMVFTPFTGIDNHKKSVTFACALLSNEDEESFAWVFEKFMDAVGRKEPQIIITDQDPAIRNAVPKVFKTARHRFCLWHIMNKVNDKIDIITRKETDFLSRINGVVWNQNLEPTEFEIKWNEVINEFGLGDNRWLSTMFDIREYWIPTYFRDLHMRNIMSTTQRSESENSFFKKFENHYGTLVEFRLRYESAMDQQRHTHKRLEMESNNYVPKTITPLSLESHALTVHIFWIFSNKLLKTIPGKYILTRWSKNALRRPIYDLNGNIIENYDAADEPQLEMSKVWSEFYNVIFVVAKKEADVLRDLQRVLREFKDTVEPPKEKMGKRQEMEMLIGCNTPDEVRILPPRHSKNKGSGKRIVTSKNKAIEKAKKPRRSDIYQLESRVIFVFIMLVSESLQHWPS